MSYLKNADTGTLITRYADLNFQYTANTTVQTALDGTEYLTRFGSPTQSYLVTVWVQDAGRDAVMQAADQLSMLEVSVRQGVFHGRIKSLGNFEKIANRWYKAELALSSASEVTDR